MADLRVSLLVLDSSEAPLSSKQVSYITCGGPGQQVIEYTLTHHKCHVAIRNSVLCRLQLCMQQEKEGPSHMTLMLCQPIRHSLSDSSSLDPLSRFSVSVRSK